jgi:DNA-binding MarR family transcriptional regulator
LIPNRERTVTGQIGTDERLELADSLGRQLMRFMRLVGRNHAHLPEVYREGLEKVGYVLLATLVQGGPRRVTAVAETVHLDISTVSRQVADLIKAGWVERQHDPDDGRAFLLAVTEAGRAVYDRIRARRNEHMAQVLDGWTTADRQRLIDLLDRFNTDFEDYLPRVLDAHGCPDKQREKHG